MKPVMVTPLLLLLKRSSKKYLWLGLYLFETQAGRRYAKVVKEEEGRQDKSYDTL